MNWAPALIIVLSHALSITLLHSSASINHNPSDGRSLARSLPLPDPSPLCSGHCGRGGRPRSTTHALSPDDAGKSSNDAKIPSFLPYQQEAPLQVSDLHDAVGRCTECISAVFSLPSRRSMDGGAFAATTGFVLLGVTPGDGKGNTHNKVGTLPRFSWRLSSRVHPLTN